MNIILKGVRLLLLLLNYLLTVFSIALAVPFVATYWLIWLIWLLFSPTRKTQKRVVLPPAADLREISIDRLLGSKANPVLPKEIDAVFEGGEVKALAQAGAARAAEQLNLKWSLLGGTSGGAIVASLLAFGKRSDDIWQLLTDVGLHRFIDAWYLPAVPFLQKRFYFYVPLLANLMMTKGLASGKVFLNTMRDILKNRNGEDSRFNDVEFLNPERGEAFAPRHRLKMVATDISRQTPIVLPDDLPDYWEAWEEARKRSGKEAGKLTADDTRDWWPVAKAVRMSMSIPFFFSPVYLHLNVKEDGKTVEKEHMGRKGQTVMIVDGGVSSNFPIWLFDRLESTPRCPTFGFLLDESKGTSMQPSRVSDLLTDLASSVIFTGIGAMDKRLSEHDRYRTASLQTGGVRTTEFGLTTARQIELVEYGFNDAKAFFKGFNWEYYLKRFRR